MLTVYSRKRRIKMGKRCLSLLLVLALCLAGIPAAVFADESSPAEEISPELPFTDVKPGDWHYEYIRSAFIHGIVTGMTATTYVPEGKLTHAQVMVMAANLHSKQKKDNYDFQGNKKVGEPWYQVFKDYCKAEGIIDDRFDGKENEEVTRAEMSCYFAHTMTPNSYQERKAVSLSDIGSDPYKAEIEKLALADIVGGFTDGTFRPDDPVTRAQSAVYVRNTVDTIEELEAAVPEDTPAGGTAHKEESGGAPVITTQPQDATVDEGGGAEFVVAASGAKLTYQWEVSADGTAWADATDEGGTTNTLSVTGAANNNGYQYRCAVTNGTGTVYSDPAVLTVILAPPEPAEPEITAQPGDAAALPGKTASFTVTAAGAESWQWEVSQNGGVDWANSTDPGSDTDTLTVTVESSMDDWLYRCTVSNIHGSVTSSAAKLTVITAPVITGQPQDTQVEAGNSVTLTITATFTESWKWEYSEDEGETWKDCTYPGSDTDTITFTVDESMDLLRYRCTVSNSVGSTISAGAIITVCGVPVITKQPQDLTTPAGTTAKFTVEFRDEGSQFHWFFWEYSDDGTNWTESSDEGHDTDTLKVSAVDSLDGRQYRCRIENDYGDTYSDGVVLKVGVPLDKKYFPDEAFLAIASAFDGDGSGYLNGTELASAITIDGSYKGITTFEGLQYFTALRIFNCSGNSLTELDLTALTGLMTLICSECDLTELDLSANVDLQTVQCDRNSLTQLTLGNNTQLTSLDCHSNADLTSVDLSACTALADAIVNGSRSDCDSYWEYAKDSALLRVGKDVDVTPADPRPFLEIHEDNFSDENFRSVVSGFDSDGDGWLSRADLAAVTAMDCSDKSISNIDGIEFFTALTTLDCSNNQLMELNVSNSKGLTTLDCSNNLLSSLDLNQNLALTTLDCNWNSLTSLNVSSCSALTTLVCYANRMEQLDLSGCTALRELVCRSTHLVSLTISGKAAFTTLDCRNNELESLSVTDCPALTSVLFTGNNLKSVDLSGCTALTGVNFGASVTGGDLETANLSGCTALTEVSCTDRNLISLDLNGCSSLKTVSCFNNKLTSLNVGGCAVLETLDCSNNNLESLNVSDSAALCDAITLGEKTGTDIVTYSYNSATLTVNGTVSLTPPDPNH